ncbi:hypothetical protein TNCV_2420441 [Trichonephila clavipes]|nr:hypothetical protein TNCV_2420441 [Trichonephila clavipes]
MNIQTEGTVKTALKRYPSPFLRLPDKRVGQYHWWKCPRYRWRDKICNLVLSVFSKQLSKAEPAKLRHSKPNRNLKIFEEL